MQIPDHQEEGYSWAFISYSRRDEFEPDGSTSRAGRNWGTWLQDQIETYDIPDDLSRALNDRKQPIPDRITPVFRDLTDLGAGSDLSGMLQEKLREARSLVVIASPRAVASAFVDEEIRYYKQHHGPDAPVLVALIAGNPQAPAGSPEDPFPPALRHHLNEGGKVDPNRPVSVAYADFRLPDKAEGWTAARSYRKDLEEGGSLSRREVDQAVERYEEAKQFAKLRLLSGVLGVDLRKLQERDKYFQLRQARRRLRTVTFVSVLVTVLMVFAIYQKYLAVTLKVAAQDATMNMVTELHDQLQPVGQLSLLDKVLAQAGSYFEVLDHYPLAKDEKDWESRGIWECNQGSLELDRGRLKEAGAHFEKAGDYFGRLSSGIAKYRHDRSRAVWHLALVEQRSGKGEKANDLFQEAADLSRPAEGERLTELEARNRWLCLTAWGDFFQDRDDYRDAEAKYAEAMDLAGSFAAEADKDGQLLWQHYQAVSLRERGWMRFLTAREGEAEQGVRWMEESLELAEKSKNECPGDIRFRRDLADALEAMARLHGEQEVQPGSADRLFETLARANALRKEICDIDPSNARSMIEQAQTLSELGRLELRMDRKEEASKTFEEVLKIEAQLTRQDDLNLLWKEAYARALLGIGAVCYYSDFDQCVRYLEQSASLIAELQTSDPENSRWGYLGCRALLLRAQTSLRSATKPDDDDAKRAQERRAKDCLAEVESGLSRLVNSESGNIAYQRDLAFSHSLFLLLDGITKNNAEMHIRSAVRILDGVVRQGQGFRREDRRITAETYCNCGVWCSDAGLRSDATMHLEKAERLAVDEKQREDVRFYLNHLDNNHSNLQP